MLEASPDELLVTFRAVDSTAVETSTVSDLRRFRVASGTPAVELL